MRERWLSVLYCVSYASKPGKEAALEAVLADPAFAQGIARLTGASHEVVLVQGNRFVQLFELSEADIEHARARVLQAHSAPEMRDLLRKLAPLLSDPFDPDDSTSLNAFLQRHRMKVVMDARRAATPPSPRAARTPAAKPSSPPPALHAAPR